MSREKKPALTEDRLMELRTILLDGFELGPLDRQDLNEVIVEVLGRREAERNATKQEAA